MGAGLRWSAVAFLLCAALLSACTMLDHTPGAGGKGISSAVGPRADEAITQLRAYRVGPGDELKVTLRGSQTLLGIAAVGDDGIATLPRKGDTQVAGLTLEAIANYIEKDQGGVAVTLNEAPGVYVVGAVGQPGSVTYRDGLTLGALLTQAGGATHKAELRTVWIKPRHASAESKVNFDAALPVFPGDVVRLEERYF